MIPGVGSGAWSSVACVDATGDFEPPTDLSEAWVLIGRIVEPLKDVEAGDEMADLGVNGLRDSVVAGECCGAFPSKFDCPKLRVGVWEPFFAMLGRMWYLP